MFLLDGKIFDGSLYESRRGVGPGGFSGGVEWLHAALPNAGVSRVRFQETLSTPFSGVPLAVHKKDKRAGLHRKFLVKCPKWPGPGRVQPRLLGGENERVGFAE